MGNTLIIEMAVQLRLVFILYQHTWALLKKPCRRKGNYIKNQYESLSEKINSRLIQELQLRMLLH